MELRKPPPVRRLSTHAVPTGATVPGVGDPGPAPVPVDHDATSTNGNGGSPFVAARRRVQATSIAIDRMQVEGLSVSYGSKVAVNTVSLPIRQGEVLALIGPSGCGKTTLLRSLNRLTELTKSTSYRGRITLDGRDIAEMEPTQLRRRVTMVFQQPNPFPMSVFDNVAYVLREQAARRPKRAALREAVRETLARGVARRGRGQP
jgi:phosphate transport system ATP-binding protein